MILNVDAYPLAWPEGWERSAEPESSRYRASFAKARDELVRGLRLMGADQIVISSNVPTRKDGLPYAKVSPPKDPGVAVYWVAGGHESSVIACDRWDTVAANLRAVGVTIEALRTMDRAGATQAARRAYMGFRALPSSPSGPTWRSVMGFHPADTVNIDRLNRRYLDLVKRRHPDHGGTDEQFRELVDAYQQAKRLLGEE